MTGCGHQADLTGGDQLFDQVPPSTGPRGITPGLVEGTGDHVHHGRIHRPVPQRVRDLWQRTAHLHPSVCRRRWRQMLGRPAHPITGVPLRGLLRLLQEVSRGSEAALPHWQSEQSMPVPRVVERPVGVPHHGRLDALHHTAQLPDLRLHLRQGHPGLVSPRGRLQVHRCQRLHEAWTHHPVLQLAHHLLCQREQALQRQSTQVLPASSRNHGEQTGFQPLVVDVIHCQRHACHLLCRSCKPPLPSYIYSTTARRHVKGRRADWGQRQHIGLLCRTG